MDCYNGLPCHLASIWFSPWEAPVGEWWSGGSLERLGSFLFSAPSVPSQGQCLCSFIPGRISYQLSLLELLLLLVHVTPPSTPCSGLGRREGKSPPSAVSWDVLHCSFLACLKPPFVNCTFTKVSLFTPIEVFFPCQNPDSLNNPISVSCTSLHVVQR